MLRLVQHPNSYTTCIYYIDTKFPFTKKSCLHHIQWRYYFYLSCEDIGVAMVTNINFDFWNRKYKYYYLYFSFITLYPSFITFCDRHFVIGDHFNCTTLLFREWIKKSCVLCRNFISIYKINRTLHGRLGIRILSSRAESISHEWAHSWEIQFVSPRGHVISSIYPFCTSQEKLKTMFPQNVWRENKRKFKQRH